MSQTFWKLSVILSVLLLAPRAGLAEEAALEDGPFQRAALPRSLHLLEDLAEPAITEQAPSSEMRVATVALGALMVGSLAGLGGYALTAAQCPHPSGCGLNDITFPRIALFAALGVPLGAWLGGMYSGGKGSLGSALGGTAAGGGIGIIAAVLLDKNLGTFSFLLFPLSAVVGAVLSYELSHAAHVAEAAAVQPMVSVSSRGAALGLGGRF